MRSKRQGKLASQQQGPGPAQRHDTMEEIVVLREVLESTRLEVTQLREALDSTRFEVIQLKGEVAVLHEKTRFLKTKPSFVQPPVEILRIIFSCALPPSSLLDPSLAAGPQSPWSKALRLKKSIVRVCKLWHAIGLEFLYEEVVFRRIDQIPAFLRTLETSSISDNLVKKITISAYIPQKYGLSCQKHLQSIFSFCRQVHRFTLASPNELPDTITLPITHSHITTLEVNDTFNYDSLLPVLVRICDTLQSLSFHPTKSDKLHTAIRFSQLKTLACDIWQAESAPALTAISGAWAMPALEYLTFGTRYWLPTNIANHSYRIVNARAIHTFCLAHGRRLRFLLIGPSQPSWSSDMHMQNILDACQSLEHLVFRCDPSDLWISHRNIKWIDFWPYEKPEQFTHVSWPWEKVIMPQVNYTKNTLPALQGIRILMHGLPSMFDIPLSIPPSWATSKDSFAIQYPGMDIRFERGFLYNSTPTGKDAVYAASCSKDYLGIDGSTDDSDDDAYLTESESADSISYISDIVSARSSSSEAVDLMVRLSA